MRFTIFTQNSLSKILRITNLEIPEKLVEGKKRPEEYQLTSKKKGFLRFQTDFIIERLEKIYDLKEEMRHTLVPFISKFLRILLAKKNIFF